MRFKQQHFNEKLPEIDLIPMLNVMMGILAFFVMITMSLTVEQGMDIQLPAKSTDSTQSAATSKPFVAILDAQGQIQVNGQPVTQTALKQQIQVYFANNPEGVVALRPESGLVYEQVIQLLNEMRQVGGDRVLLAID